eukprot:CAMPEP_0114418566 /NCGR_PEP_ID=MMETSP0103-20121206/3564_1 /TAXON_ID=37642 ORGANISM="Paraphysomonas imperforata, Strain PA2" /NCGR_SAMPLE_ID=MMETSP0103 /ASSEMBLY_ACC=CAM_ASM_000201 /LENGTH=1137 /DNA_ID=CAMNT_0001586931 /DNA_START=202 /DNA_END=3616 /DNA_ORIENTATION=-
MSATLCAGRAGGRSVLWPSLSRSFRRIRALHSTSRQEGGTGARALEPASQLSLDFAPAERVRKYLSELDALLAHRSTVATSELVTLLIYLHDTGLQVPLEYFRSAVDICAFRGDASAVSLLLGLARKNFRVFPSAGASLDPLDELHKFALTKLTKHGSMSDTLLLWKEGGAEQRYLEDAPVLRAVMSKAAGRHHQADVHVLELLQQRVTAGSWDQSPQYFVSLLGNLRDHFRALGSVGEADLVSERARLDAALTRAAACLPQSAAQGAASGSLDAHTASVISALKVQCLVALATAQRTASCHEAARALLAEAKAESGTMLGLDAGLTGRGVETNRAEIVDSGDVAAGVMASPPGVSGTTGTRNAHMTDLQKGLLGVLEEQRQQYSGQSGGAEPLSHVMRSSLLKRSRLTRIAGKDMHESGAWVFDGVDVGAEYHAVNNEEHSRRALLDLLRESSHSLEGRYPEEALALLQGFLVAHHPQRRSVGREGTAPLNRVLSPCYDAATVPADMDFAMTRLASTAHPSFGSLAPSVPLARHAPIQRASDDTFLKHLVCQALYNSVHMHNRDMLSEQAGGPAYKQIASFARRLHVLSLKYGIDCGVHFHARWILALPLLATPRMAPEHEHEHEQRVAESTEERAARMCWRTSLTYCMRVRASYVENAGGDGAVSEEQRAVLTHAVVAHLCGYRCEEAFHYATHLVHEQAARGANSVLPLTWNTLLTTATVMRRHEDIIFTINELRRHCAGADLPLSAAERRLQGMVGAQDAIEDSFFTDCIHAKPAAGAADRDPNLLMALLRAQLALKNGYEALNLMKQLRHCGVVVGRADYARLLRALGTFRGAALESQKSPLQLFASVRVDVTSDFLLHEMRNDGVVLDSALICGLVGLYAYPAQWHRSNAEVMESCRSIEVGGVSASRQAVQQAMQLLDESCRAGGLAVDQDMLLELIRVCCAGGHDDLAMDVISSAVAACDREPEEDSPDGRLPFRVPLSAVLFSPMLSLHCRRVGGLTRAEGLLQSMREWGIAPSADMLGEVVALLVRKEDLRVAVTQVSRLHELTGVLPAREAVLALLDSLLVAKNGDRGARGGEDDVQRLLNVVGSLYSGQDEGEGEEAEGQDECIYYEDLEPLFRQHGDDLEAYDI